MSVATIVLLVINFLELGALGFALHIINEQERVIDRMDEPLDPVDVVIGEVVEDGE